MFFGMISQKTIEVRVRIIIDKRGTGFPMIRESVRAVIFAAVTRQKLVPTRVVVSKRSGFSNR